jgi:hypothetical protein
MALQGRITPGSLELLEETIVASGTSTITYDGIFDNDKYSEYTINLNETVLNDGSFNLSIKYRGGGSTLFGSTTSYNARIAGRLGSTMTLNTDGFTLSGGEMRIANYIPAVTTSTSATMHFKLHIKPFNPQATIQGFWAGKTHDNFYDISNAYCTIDTLATAVDGIQLGWTEARYWVSGQIQVYGKKRDA